MGLVAPWDGADSAFALDSPDVWDRGSVAGIELFSPVRISGSISRKLDVKSAPTKSGARVASLGMEPARFDLVVTLWTEAQIDQWYAVVRLLRDDGAPRAVDVVHPALDMYGIRSAIAERISLPEKREKGIYEARISFVEFREPRPANKGGSPAVGGSLDRPTVVGPAPTTTRAAKDPATSGGTAP